MTARTVPAPAAPPLRRIGASVAPLSFAQQRLWLIDAGSPGSATYNVPLLMRWLEPVDAACLGAALTEVVARHEALRTTYEVREDQPVQVVNPPAPVPVEVVVAEDALAGAAERAREPFDLAAGPLLRCWLWPGVPGGDRVLLLVHHIAIDGWSLATLFEDLAEAYDAALSGRRPALPPLPVQYPDFARWDRDVVATPAVRNLVAERVAELLAVDANLALAGARPAPARAEGDRPGHQHVAAVPDDVWARVREVAASLRATPFVVLLAAFQQTLWHWSGREEFVIGTFTANRPHPDLERTIGYFVGTVPLRCRVPAGRSFAELCGDVRAEAYRSLTYQRLPYDQLVATAAVTQPGGHQRLTVNVGFALQNMPAPQVANPRWAEPRLLGTGTAKLDLLMIVEEHAGRGVCVLEHDTDRYPTELAERFAADFIARLAAGTADPQTPLAAVSPRPLPPAGAGGRAHPRPAPAASPVRAKAPWPAPAERAVPATDHAAALELFTEALAEVRREAPALWSGQLRPASNFFALGGNSMLAMSMLARARRRHGVAASPARFLAEPTVAGLGRLLGQDAAAAPASAAGLADRYPATPTQQRFWTIDRISALRESYLVPTVLELHGEVDRDALARAADLVLARHPALRSRFELDRAARQVLYRTDGPAATTTLVDATGWDAGAVRAHLASVCWSAFDLDIGPVARAQILALPGRTVLVLVVHHIVTDGWSQRLLLDQLAQVYRAELTGRAARLADPVHPAHALATPDPVDRTEETIARLSGAPTDVQLPHDRPRPGRPCTRGAVHIEPLDARLTEELRAIAADHSCSTFMITAGLLAVVLARQGDQRDFLLAFPWAGREGPDDAVGLFVDTSLVRVDLRQVRGWRDLLATVRDSGAAAYRAARVPFERLVAALHPERDLSRPAVTPVYLSAGDRPPGPPWFGSAVQVRQRVPEPLRIKYELELTAVDEPDHLRFELAYAVELFDRGTVRRLASQLVAAATDLVTDLDADPLRGTR